MTDSERQAIGDLAMRALDTINDMGGKLRGACLVFEVEVEDGELFDHRYVSMPSMTTSHAGGLMYACGQHMLSPESDE